MRPRRTLAVAVLPAAALLLTACSVTTSDKPAVPAFNPLDPASDGSSASGTGASTGPDLQLRPVLTAERAEEGQCPATDPPTPRAAEPATLCSADRTMVVELAPAVVSGPRVVSVDAGTLSGGPTVRVTLDVVGGTALSNATLALSQKQSPQNWLAVVSHGRVQATPAVGDQITGGVLDLTGFASTDDARAAAALFGG